jgi:hypothetical protein
MLKMKKEKKEKELKLLRLLLKAELKKLLLLKNKPS